MKAKHGGFTLIELMIAVAVIGILAAVAYPAYTDSVKKGRRSDAKIALTNAAQALERFYNENNSTYNATGSAAGTLFPTTSQGGYYTIGYASGSPTTSAYTLTATPTGSQANDKCGIFTLNNLGVQGVSGGSLNAANCW
jgi:type IV pilus assembly protein PilE